MLLALEALNATPEPQREAIEALHAAVLTSRSELPMPWPDDIPFGGMGELTATTGGAVAITGDGGTIALHDGPTGSYLGVLDPGTPAPPGWDPFDAATIDSSPATGEVAAVYGDHVLRVWEPDSGRLVWSANAAADPQATDLPPAAGSTVYSPDGRWLAVITYDDPWTLSVWDATTGERQWVQALAETMGPVVASFSPSGDELAIAWWMTPTSGTGQVAVLDRETGTEKRRVDPSVPIGSIAWSPDGTKILHGTEAGALMVWSSDLLQLISVRNEHSGSLDTIEFSTDGSWFATSGHDGTVKIWAVDPLDPVLTLATPTSPRSIAFAPDGNRLFTAEPDGVVQTWTIGPEGRGELMAATPSGSVLGVDVDTSGQNVIAHSHAGRFNPGGVTVWDTATGRLRYDINRLDDFAFGGVTYLPDGARFAVQTMSDVLDPDTGKTATSYGAIQIRDAVDGAVLLDLEGSEGFDRQQLSASTDGRYVASGGTADQDRLGSASIYDLTSGGLVHRLQHPDWAVTGTAFSPDGSLLATGTCMNGVLRIWDWERKSLLQEVEHSDCVTRVAFSPTASLVAVTGYGGSTLVWDVDASHEAYSLAEEAGEAFSVTFSPDGQRIVTAGIDGTLRVWDAADGSELLAVPLSSTSLGDVAFFPGGDRIAASSVDGNLWVVTLDTDDLADTAQSRLTRGFTADECDRYHIDPCPTG